MESLFNTFGVSAALGVVVLLAAPLAFVGWGLRRHGRRGLERLARIKSARVQVGDVRGGAVTLVGRWRRVGAGRGLLEDDTGRAVLVLHDGAAPDEAAGFLVTGTAVREVDDPRALDYRSSARLWMVDARSEGVFGDEAAILAKAERAAARGAGLGAFLFAAGVAVAMASVVMAIRASIDWMNG